MHINLREGGGTMVDYMIFVRATINEAIEYGKKVGFESGAIAVEVKNLPKENSVTNIHEFIFCEVMTTSDFNDHQKTEFLRAHVHSAHERHQRGENIASTGWGPALITIGYKTLFFPEEPSDYSIVVGVMSDRTKTSQQILNAVLDGIPDNQH